MKSGAWAVAAVLAGAFTSVSTVAVHAGPAAADDGYYRDRYDRDRYGSRGYGYGPDTFRIGLDHGYREGLREGRRDGERRREYRFSSDRRFRRGDAGYRRSYGPRYVYARGFRAGYERGYRAGYEDSIRHGYGRNRYYYKYDPYRRGRY